jgi:2-dehydropantoate 2-reductase
MTAPRIAVVGAGAIGSSVAADLLDAGVDVHVIDQWPAHVEAMRRDGLRVVMPDREVTVPVHAYHASDLAALTPELDIVFLAVKCYDTSWMSQLIAMYLHPDGVVVGLQNGMVNDLIAAAVGASRTVGGVVELSAELSRPGYVQRDTPRSGTWLAVGELDGQDTPRVRRIADLLRHVARVGVSDNIAGAKWTKLIVNAMTMGPHGLLGLTNWEAAALPGMFELSVRLGREALTVGQRLGHRIEPIFGLTASELAGSGDDVLVTAMKTLLGHVGSSSTTAIVQDRRRGRRTEQEHITGQVVRSGREVRVPTPANEAVLQISRAIDRGDLPMEAGNLDRLKALLADA